jgi:hypothetical protein
MTERLSTAVVSGEVLSLRAWSIERSLPVFLKFSSIASPQFAARAKLEIQSLRTLEAAGIDCCTKPIALEQSKYGLLCVHCIVRML